MVFTELCLKNFRAWEYVQIPLRPITLVFGPNNSGKSALLSSLPLLAQTVESADLDVPLLLNGEYLELGTYKDVVFRNDKRRSISMGISLKFNDDTDMGTRRLRRNSPFSLETRFRFRSQRRQIVLASSSVTDTLRTSVRQLLVTRYSPKNDAQIIERALRNVAHLKPGLVGRQAARNHFLNPTAGILRPPAHGSAERFFNLVQATRHVDRVEALIASTLRSLEYLGPLRQAPSRTYLFSGQSPSSVGRSGERAIDILVADYLRRGAAKARLLETISKWMKAADLAKGLEVRPLSDRHYEVMVKHHVTGEMENIADVGSGLSQILPVLVAGYWMDRPSTLILEHPEIHLHPRAQAELGQLVLELFRRKVQLLIETHSEHLLLRVQRLVAEGKIRPEDVAVYYTYAERGKKKLQPLSLSEQGLFVDKWKHGFFPERLEEATAILRGGARRGRR